MTRAEWTRLGGFSAAVVLLHVAGFGLFVYYLPRNPALAGLALVQRLARARQLPL